MAAKDLAPESLQAVVGGAPFAGASGLDDEEARAYQANRRRQLWRTRVMPALGVAVLLFAWWAVVAGFNVRPFIAPRNRAFSPVCSRLRISAGAIQLLVGPASSFCALQM